MALLPCCSVAWAAPSFNNRLRRKKVMVFPTPSSIFARALYAGCELDVQLPHPVEVFEVCVCCCVASRLLRGWFLQQCAWWKALCQHDSHAPCSDKHTREKGLPGIVYVCIARPTSMILAHVTMLSVIHNARAVTALLTALSRRMCASSTGASLWPQSCQGTPAS